MTTIASGTLHLNVRVWKSESDEKARSEAAEKVFSSVSSDIREHLAESLGSDAVDQALASNPNALLNTFIDFTKAGQPFSERELTQLLLELEYSTNDDAMKERLRGMQQSLLALSHFAAMMYFHEKLLGVSRKDAFRSAIERLFAHDDRAMNDMRFGSITGNLHYSMETLHEQKREQLAMPMPWVSFPQRFARKPKVMLGISGIKTTGGALHLNLEAINISNEGFSLTSLPFHIALDSVTVSWLAIEGSFERPANITATASAYQPEDAPSHAVDGNSGTMWHTPWDGSAALPQSITLDFGGVYPLVGLQYTPRQDGTPNGNILSYTIEVSSDGESFSKVAQGYWAEDNSKKDARFAETNARFVRLVAHVGCGGYASATEVVPVFAGEA